MNHYIFAMRTYSETMSTVQMQRHFRHESDVPRHGKIPSCNAVLKWVYDFNVHGSVVNKCVGPANRRKLWKTGFGCFEVHFHLSSYINKHNST
jgi:hypothetical protein